MSTENSSTNRAARWWVRGGVAAFIAVMVTLMIMNMPRGFDTNLTKIGQGKPSLVFVYDPNYVISNEQTQEIDQVRALAGDNVVFLLADLGREEARAFVKKYEAELAEILIFTGEGSLIRRLHAPMDADVLAMQMQEALGQFQ